VKGEALGPAGLGRRFAALVYDSLLLVAVLFLGTLLLLPLTGGEAITPQDSGALEYLYRGWIALLTLGFFGLPWVRTGQTLGMMSWKLRLERMDGGRIGWIEIAGRLAIGALVVTAAVAGLWFAGRPGTPAWLPGLLLLPTVANYLWMGFDREARTLQDLLTGCRVVRIG
jgi:uncharacterized RDD family membrane protein YckC